MQSYIALLGRVQKEKTSGKKDKRHPSRRKNNNKDTNIRREYIVLGSSEPSTNMDGVTDKKLFRNLTNNIMEEDVAFSKTYLCFFL